jgi:hypothetical protein
VEAGLPLNFRVPADFRRAFKTYAAQHDLKLNELLKLSFDSYRKQRDKGRRGRARVLDCTKYGADGSSFKMPG